MSEPRAVAATRISVEQWQAIDQRSPAPTFFARPAWALALADAYAHFEPAPFRVQFDDGVTAIVPMMRSRGRLPWRIFVGMPIGSYTTVHVESSTGSQEERSMPALRYLLNHAGDSVTIRPWPFAHVDVGTVSGRKHAVAASVIDLQDGADAALSRMDGKSRRMAGQAERRGVQCAMESGPGAISAYYTMLAEAACRWGKARPTIPQRLIDAAVDHGGADVQIWLARYDGEPVAGGIVLFGSEEMFFWTAAMRAEFGTLRPSNALNVALIRAAAQRAVRWFNLGASEGLPGVRRFKEGLGAMPVSSWTVVRHTPLFSTYARLRNMLHASRNPSSDTAGEHA